MAKIVHSYRFGLLMMCMSVAGCTSTGTPIPPCCYEGPVTTARLADLPVRLKDGRNAQFQSIFTNFLPQTGLFTRSLPVDEMRPQDMIYASLVPLLALYDANGDGRLERPEIVVLYAREAAIASGIPVAHFGQPPGIWAISTSNADIGGLVHWVESRRPTMSAQGQRVFSDLDNLGRDQRSDGNEYGGQSGDRYEN